MLLFHRCKLVISGTGYLTAQKSSVLNFIRKYKQIYFRMSYRVPQRSEIWAIHLRDEAGRRRKLQITPAAKNPQPSVIASQLQSSGLGTFLYTGITISTRGQDMAPLLCSTRQCTDGCSCCSNYGGTSWWQNCAENDSVCPRVCEQARGGWRKWTDCLLSDTGRLRPPGLTAVPSLRLCITSTVNHPSQGASLQLTPGRQSTKGVTVDVSAPTFYNPKYFPSHRGNKTRISFLVCGQIFQPFRPRLHLYNILSIQKLSQETWKPALNWDELKPLLIGKAIHSRW